MTKGTRRQKSKKSNKGDENIISNGSIIAVNEGQCMLLVQQGEIIEVCAEAGEFVFDSGTEPSVLYGSLDYSIKDTFKLVGKRFSFLGDSSSAPRIYYVNIMTITGNEFELPAPLPVCVTIDDDFTSTVVHATCSGKYSYRISNPPLFYKNVACRSSNNFARSEIDSELTIECTQAIQAGFESVFFDDIPYTRMLRKAPELSSFAKDELTSSWARSLGISVTNVFVKAIEVSPEDDRFIREAQREKISKSRTTEIPRIIDLLELDSPTVSALAGFSPAFVSEFTRFHGMATKDGWRCPKCNAENKGKFCTECGTSKTVKLLAWECPKSSGLRMKIAALPAAALLCRVFCIAQIRFLGRGIVSHLSAGPNPQLSLLSRR
jgi:membrane protease subunit (stomatin/prohibitin family)